MTSTLTGAEAVGLFVAIVVILAAIIYLPAIIAPPREKSANKSSGGGGGGWGGSGVAERFGGPGTGVRAAPRVAPPDIALPIAHSQNWCGNSVTPQRESRTASGPIREIALEFSDGW